MHDSIVVLNHDDRVCRVVVRKLRAERICCRIMAGSSILEDIQNESPSGIILAGNCEENREAVFDSRILQAGIPILALGGASLHLVRLLGGSTESRVFDKGLHDIRFAKNTLTSGIDDQERMVNNIVPVLSASGIIPVCTCDDAVIGYSHELLPVYGIQLPVEQNDPDISVLLKNFAVSICGCVNDWDDLNHIAKSQDDICALAGDGNVVCVITGGLSTAVCAVLAQKVIGTRLKCIFVETGLLRKDESSAFISDVVNRMGLDTVIVDKSREILSVLSDISDPDEKRRLIREYRESAFCEQIEKIDNVRLIIRGINMDDMMQGNVSPVPDSLLEKYRIYEPLHQLFRNEIRHIAEVLGMPADFVAKQSFPGTGLALRIRGTVDIEKLEILRTCDVILAEEIERTGVKRLLKWFASIGDDTGEKNRKYTVYLRAVNSGSGDSALPARLPYDMLERVVERILDNCDSVGRVLYDLTPANEFSEIEYR